MDVSAVSTYYNTYYSDAMKYCEENWDQDTQEAYKTFLAGAEKNLQHSQETVYTNQQVGVDETLKN